MSWPEKIYAGIELCEAAALNPKTVQIPDKKTAPMSQKVGHDSPHYACIII